MKCPERYKISQLNIKKSMLNDEEIIRGEYHILIENQAFDECYKENCAAWDKENQRCKKVGN